MLQHIPTIIGGAVAGLTFAALFSFASHMADASGFAACFDAIGDAAHCRQWAQEQQAAPPVIPCTTDSDCMDKNPHLGEF